MKLLHLDAGLQTQSVSRQLSAAVVSAWRAAQPQLQLTYRDLAADPPPHMSGDAWRQLKFGEPVPDASKPQMERLEAVVSEFLAADAVVIGAPMYNFSVASTLKCWIDAICQPGRTFAYSPQGVRGLAGGKRVVIASTRGNRYEGAAQARDFQEPYLRTVLGFIGVTDIAIVRAEGLNLAAHREAALADAHAQIQRLFAAPAEALA
jgi:FMN-dependent NADH-azoreductase